MSFLGNGRGDRRHPPRYRQSSGFGGKHSGKDSVGLRHFAQSATARGDKLAPLAAMVGPLAEKFRAAEKDRFRRRAQIKTASPEQKTADQSSPVGRR